MATAEEYDDSYDEYEEDGEVTISGFTVLLVAVVVLAVFSGIVWIAYQKGLQSSRSSEGNVPIVAADPNPVKTERDLAIPTTERPEVYDRLEGATPTEVIVEAEADRDPLEGFETTASASQPATGQPATGQPSTGQPATAQPAAEQPKVELPASTASMEKAGVPPINVVKAPTEQPVTQPKPAATATATAKPPVVVSSGTHVVQIGAFRAEDEALTTFSKMSDKLGTYMAGKSPDIERADLGDKGIYYRLRVGPFASKDDAATYCEGLKTRGQDCLVKAR